MWSHTPDSRRYKESSWAGVSFWNKQWFALISLSISSITIRNEVGDSTNPQQWLTDQCKQDRGCCWSMHRFPADPTKEARVASIESHRKTFQCSFSTILIQFFGGGKSLSISQWWWDASTKTKLQCAYLETALSVATTGSTSTDGEPKSLSASIGEPLLSDFGVH